MDYRILGKTGLEISALGFGASPLGSVFRPVAEEEGIRAVHMAIDVGINFIDVAPYYGLERAEEVLGRALRSVSRDRYYLATKVGRYGDNDFDFSPQRVTSSVDESLSRLNLEYIDLIQCHDIEFASVQQIVQDTLPALRRLQKAGKVRFIGITGLPLKVFRAVLERTKVDAVLSYCRYSLNDTSLQELLPFLQERQVGVISASPLSMGLLTQSGAPPWHPAPPEIKTACAEAADYCNLQGVDIAQLALQFALANTQIGTVLVGTASPEHLRRNVPCLDSPLDKASVAEVRSILMPILNQTWPSGRMENN